MAEKNGSLLASLSIDPATLDRLRGAPQAAAPTQAPEKRYDDLFLYRPVRLGWLLALNALDKTSRWLGMVLWYRASRRNSLTFPASNTALEPLGISRGQKKRALEKLDAAGLISVEWRERKNPIVTIKAEAGPTITGKEDEE